LLAQPKPKEDRTGQIQIDGEWVKIKDLVGSIPAKEIKEEPAIQSEPKKVIPVKIPPQSVRQQWLEDAAKAPKKTNWDLFSEYAELWCPLGFYFDYE